MYLSRSSYFSLVALLTLLWLSIWLSGQPAILFELKSRVGLAEDLSVDHNSFYSQRVQPILAEYCESCHGEKKAKDGLRLDKYKYVFFGGEEGSAAIGTDAHSNILLKRMLLHPNDIKVMPPLGRPRPTTKEIKVLSLWIEAGASSTSPPEAFPKAPAAVQEIVFPGLDFEHINVARAPYATELRDLKKQYPSSISYIARNSKYIEINGLSMGPDFSDEVLVEFRPLFPIVSSVDLTDTALSDLAVEELFSMSELRIARVANTNLSVEAVQRLLQLPNLEMLVVGKAQASDAIRLKAKELGIRFYVGG